MKGERVDLGSGYEGSYLLAAALRASFVCVVLLLGCCFVVAERFLRFGGYCLLVGFFFFVSFVVNYYFW